MYTSVRGLVWICSSLWRICGKRRQSGHDRQVDVGAMSGVLNSTLDFI